MEGCLVAMGRTFASFRLQASQSNYFMALLYTMTQIEAAILAAGQQSDHLHCALFGQKSAEGIGKAKVSILCIELYGNHSRLGREDELIRESLKLPRQI